MKALIFAAGMGTRLHPLTDHTPKALVKVAGVPMLERCIRRLSAAEISSCVVNTHHFAEQIEAFIRDNPDLPIPVAISHEKQQPFETGGGIKHAAPLLRGNRFLVHNVDIISDLDFAWFFAQDSADSLATLLVTDADTDRYLLFDNNMYLVGWTNILTGEVRSPYPSLATEGSLVEAMEGTKLISDKPTLGTCKRLSFCGIHILSDQVFDLMADWPERFSIIDFYLSAAAVHPIRGAYAPQLQLIDIGSPETLALANKLCL